LFSFLTNDPLNSARQDVNKGIGDWITFGISGNGFHLSLGSRSSKVLAYLMQLFVFIFGIVTLISTSSLFSLHQYSFRSFYPFVFSCFRWTNSRYFDWIRKTFWSNQKIVNYSTMDKKCWIPDLSANPGLNMELKVFSLSRGWNYVDVMFTTKEGRKIQRLKWHSIRS
jgi:hypothetical protein